MRIMTSKIPQILDGLKIEYDRQESLIKRLREDNRKLREEYDKDVEVKELKEKMEQMKEDLWRGFPISESEEAAIRAWQDKHDIEAHGLVTNEIKLRAGGCCGGRYSYHFVPTSIGTIGTVKCSCGAKYCFQEMG